MPQHQPQDYWHCNLILIRRLLWVLIGLVFGAAILLAKVLNTVHFCQLPLGFWIAQQGSILGFIALIFVYAFKMDHLDQAYSTHEASAQKTEEQN